MQKIVIDTNVIVSSLIQRSYPYKIVNELFIEGRIKLCLSENLMLEYCEVLRRPKFSIFYDFVARAEALLADIEAKAIMYVPKIRLDLISDKDDNMILELADACAADYIITGNTTDFTFPAYKTTRIVTPREYWTIHQP
ncbi:MAG: putative toxin-antitoxin system toxin component, PIN family [Dysgonamonadaceae bacterium]|jgi:putative PIN family toxin of toxin-antitoxin system|nr:putative toxin-antitoxin system toxin component, PIN family [Dysgonamonadaceae bacterium]